MLTHEVKLDNDNGNPANNGQGTICLQYIFTYRVIFLEVNLLDQSV